MTDEELKQRQAWEWKKKVDHSLGVIDQFLSRTDGKAYVSFSGGKDSSVLLDLCRVLDKNIKAVFFNTGMEYPDIIYHVRSLQKQGYNIEIRKPSARPKDIWAETGFPLVSKEQAKKLYYMKNMPDGLTAKRGWDDPSTTMHAVSLCWRFLVKEKFNCHNKCCDILKKQPAHEYQKETGLYPIIGTMASESILRKQQYLIRGGCNSFKDNKIFSTPLAIWCEDDIWNYINDRHLQIAEIYAKGVKRTGCVCCGFGAHLDPHRYDALYRLYPKLYAQMMAFTNNGVTFREAIRKVLAVNKIQLPDEREQSLFE